MEVGDLKKVWEIKPLKKKGQDEAKRLLEKLAKQVQPIMRAHNWTVKLLSEFCPSNRSILGLNVGQGVEIKLRLRKQNREWEFIPYEEVLDTLLHELCHNEHGPHNASFYKLWDELRRECEELLCKGITGSGQGFDACGRHLGGFSRQPPLALLRESAAAAAEKRRKIQDLLPSGPRRIGGDFSIMQSLSPVQAAAMAAERRLQDEVWCASGSDKDSWSEAELGKFGNCGNEVLFDSSTSSTTSRFADSIPIEGGDGTWECSACTLLNPPLAPLCGVCSASKPEDRSKRFEVWPCKFCTLENSVKQDKCVACEQWRYSLGQSVSMYAPNRGT